MTVLLDLSRIESVSKIIPLCSLLFFDFFVKFACPAVFALFLKVLFVFETKSLRFTLLSLPLCY